MSDLEAWRAEFPVLARRTYLISASLGPLSRRSRARAEEHLDLWGQLGPEELWFEHGFPRLQECRERSARIIGADPDEIAIVPSVSAGLSALATAVDFEERPAVVLSEMDFPTNHYVWRAQERRGAKLDTVASRDGITVAEEDIVDRIDDVTAVVNVNRALFESGALLDLEPIVAAAHAHGALVVVDDFHGTGIVPVDVHALGIDVYLTGALKWLCGGQGISFLYCRRDLIEKLQPLVVGWWGTEDAFTFDRSALRLRSDARRFETGTYPLPQAWTAAGGMSIIEEVGLPAIRARSLELTAGIVARAADAGLEVLTPSDDSRRGGLVRVRVSGGRERAARLAQELLAVDVVVDQRGDALRISPHFFNNEADLDRAFAEIVRLLGVARG